MQVPGLCCNDCGDSQTIPVTRTHAAHPACSRAREMQWQRQDERRPNRGPTREEPEQIDEIASQADAGV